MRWAGHFAVEQHAEGDRLSHRRGKHEMRVARVEPAGDAAAGLREHGPLAADRPFAGKRPVVGRQALGERVGAALVECADVRRGEVLGTRVAEIGLGATQVVPVGLGFDAASSDGDGLALDTEQALDDALGLRITPLAEVTVANDSLPVEEIQRRPAIG
jgi:hypothetical protein